MRHTKIAVARPFEGVPQINLADIFGASPKKPILLRIPVTGQRPITYGAENLPSGLKLKNGIISGQVEEEGTYHIVLTAENALGKVRKPLSLEIQKDQVLLTPLLGFASWNAFGADVSQQKMTDAAKRMLNLVSVNMDTAILTRIPDGRKSMAGNMMRLCQMKNSRI